MGWQEKIEQHKARQQRKEEEKEATERAEKLRIAEEKIPPLLEALDRIKCEEMLSRIRDEVWKIGEVLVTPNIEEIDYNTSLEAKVVLEAQWPVFVEAGVSYDARRGEYTSWDDHLRICRPKLTIKANYENEEEILINISSTVNNRLTSLKFKEPDVLKRLEDCLIRDCIDRQTGLGIRLPYDQRKSEEEVAIVQAIIQRDFRPPEGFGFDYLLDMAEKARLEANKNKTKIE